MKVDRQAASYAELLLEVFRVSHVAATNATTMTNKVSGLRSASIMPAITTLKPVAWLVSHDAALLSKMPGGRACGRGREISITLHLADYKGKLLKRPSATSAAADTGAGVATGVREYPSPHASSTRKR